MSDSAQQLMWRIDSPEHQAVAEAGHRFVPSENFSETQQHNTTNNKITQQRITQSVTQTIAQPKKNSMIDIFQ
jgi:hypothetical protein